MISLTRRRVIGITAAAAGMSLVPVGNAGAVENLVVWQGEAMGALAKLRIHHPDRAFAARLIDMAVSEVRRLEEIFSLYRTDSALVELNRSGVLVSPPADLVVLLDECRRLWELSGGAFDPTIQPVWSLYYRHFSQDGCDPGGPSSKSLQTALAKVGFARVQYDRNRIVLGCRGMGLTLNGIAQGYATDRIVDLLRSQGIAHSLVDMGESYALGAHADGRPWTVGIVDPEEPENIDETLEIMDRAVATSGGYGFRFDRKGRFNHLLDPKAGRSPNLYRTVTVIATKATLADGLATAFSLIEPDNIEQVLHKLEDVEVRGILATGVRFQLSTDGPNSG